MALFRREKIQTVTRRNIGAVIIGLATVMI
jgi:hypothetical protein